MDRYKIALEAILSHSEAKLVAQVNHVDNFTYWASGYVWDTLMGTFPCDTDEACEEYNKIVEEASNKKGTWHEFRPILSPLVRSICQEAYKTLRVP